MTNNAHAKGRTFKGCRGRQFEHGCYSKVETPIHDNIRELVTWECKEHGVKS
jgi:hypothetical protein